MPVVYRPARQAFALVQARVRRTLQRPGRVLVKLGQRVVPDDVIAQRPRRYRLEILSVTQALRVPPEKASKYITCRLGQLVAQGDVLAQKPGLFKRHLVAPFQGRVLYIGPGYIVLQRQAELEQIPAGMEGEVAEVLAPYGAVVSGQGLFVQGIWGNGRLGVGLGIIIPQIFPYGTLSAALLTPELRGSVLVAEHVADEETLHQAREVAIRGLVVAGMPASLLKVALQMPYPVLVVEAFGGASFASSTAQILERLHQRDVVLVAEAPRRDIGLWPWLFSPQEAFEAVQPTRTGGLLDPESRVRVLRGPYQGRIGRVIEIEQFPRIFPSGATGYVVKLQIDDQTVAVPVNNVELVD